MATTLTLDSIREAADKKYGNIVVPLDGDEAVLTNPLRLSKADRDALTKLDVKETEDPVAYFEEVYTILGDKASAKKLVDALGEDVTLHMALFELLTKGLELGEASPSRD